MLKNVFMAIVLVIMFSACAFAQAKPLVQTKDYVIGPFKPGDHWNRQLAEKYFGEPVEVSKLSLSSPDWLDVAKDRVFPAPDEKGEFRLSADSIKFKGALFVVFDGKILVLTVTGSNIETSRGLRVGDSLEKLKKLYPVDKNIDKDVSNYITYEERYSSKFPGRSDRFFIFVDGKTKEVSGLAFHSVGLPETVIHSTGTKPVTTEDAVRPASVTLTAEDFRIGPFKVGEKYDNSVFNKAENLFGQASSHIYSDEIVGKTAKGLNVYTVDFDGKYSGSIYYTDAEKIIVEISTSYAMLTGRGLKVGDSIDKALSLYGHPYSRKVVKLEAETAETLFADIDIPARTVVHYRYGNDKKGIWLSVNEKSGIIERISVYNYLDY